MSSVLLAYCREIGCPQKVPSGYCATHARLQERQRDNYAVRRWYRTAKWRHPVWGRRSVCLRTHPYCTDCLPRGIYTQATEVHHVVKHNGDPVKFWDQANLTSLCSPCHTIRTARGE